MKAIRSCSTGILVLAMALLAPQINQAQGTTYVSNLVQSPTGSESVGNNSWIASTIETGRNPEGYLLDSVQLGMADASGNPIGFTVMIYTVVGVDGANPGSSLGTLDGSLSPVAGGIYSYTEDSNLILLPGTIYFIVLTAGTTIANGTFAWSLTIPNAYNPTGGWIAGGVWESSDGSNWLYTSGAPQFAITATPVPEPSAWALLAVSGLLFLKQRRKNS